MRNNVLSVSGEVSRGEVYKGEVVSVSWMSGEVPRGVSCWMVVPDFRIHGWCWSFHVCHFHPVHASLGHISKSIKVIIICYLKSVPEKWIKLLQSYSGRPKIKSMTDQQAVVRMMMFLLVLLSPSPNKFRKSLKFKFKGGWIKNVSFQLKKVLVSLKNKIVKWALYHIEFLSCQISRCVSNNTGKTGKTALWVTWACIAWKVNNHQTRLLCQFRDSRPREKLFGSQVIF